MVSNLIKDPINKAILQYVLDNDETHLGPLSRELKKQGFTNGREIYGKLTELADSGILEAGMVQIKHLEEPDYAETWVKMYRMSEEHKERVKELIGK